MGRFHCTGRKLGEQCISVYMLTEWPVKRESRKSNEKVTKKITKRER